MQRLLLCGKYISCLFALLILLCQQVRAQEGDSTVGPVKAFFNNIFQQVKHAVTVSRQDSIVKSTVLNTKSEDPFLPYEGKTIRHIFTNSLGFEQTFADTSNRIRHLGSRIANVLHTDTKGWVIRENLFFRSGSALNPYLMADNERYLRSLNFIQDARILVKPIRGIRDSVDVVIVTKDLFSISGGVDVNGISRVRTRVAENNLMGMGQRVQVTTLADTRRKPAFGYELLYTKTSIANSFINASLGYTVINSGPSNGTEQEKAFYLRADRQLVNPFSHLAGGLVISYNSSNNYYGKPDSLFYNYRYNTYDGWFGYNLGITKLLNNKSSIRDRSFIAVRYMRNHFNEVPLQIGNAYDRIYNSRKAVLAELTLFRQDFYKTNFIYGFGTTEDIPYGFNIAFTGGWYKQLELSRAYAGVNANQYISAGNGSFMQTFVRSGVFMNKGRMEDASVLLGTNYFSRLYFYRSLKIREYLRFSYTRVINPVASEPLRIDNSFGLQAFNTDSALGNQRLSLYAETFMFTKYKLLGFHMAPFAFAAVSWLTGDPLGRRPENRGVKGLFSGIGGGIRTRNENLVFGTIELRMMYFPKTIESVHAFKISLNSNIRFRYNGRYVKAPDVIQINEDDSNNEYGTP